MTAQMMTIHTDSSLAKFANEAFRKVQQVVRPVKPMQGVKPTRNRTLWGSYQIRPTEQNDENDKSVS
jgi:hypothetical protein